MENYADLFKHYTRFLKFEKGDVVFQNSEHTIKIPIDSPFLKRITGDFFDYRDYVDWLQQEEKKAAELAEKWNKRLAAITNRDKELVKLHDKIMNRFAVNYPLDTNEKTLDQLFSNRLA